MTALRAGAVTHVGRVRVSNQDSFLVARPMFAVADGMGGHAGGEVASRIAIETLSAIVTVTIADLVAAVKRANLAIFRQSVDAPELHGMGTTLCAVALVREEGLDRIAVVNVGDSRVYVLQDSRLMQISRDHSFVEDLVEAGELTPEEAKVHPRRNIVTRALGIEPDVEVDTWEVNPFVGDRYLLCSDGLFGELDDDTMAVLLREIKDPQQCAEALVERSLLAGARDNVTVIIVDVIMDDPLVLDGLEPDLGGWLRDVIPVESASGAAPIELASQPAPITNQPVDDGRVGGWLGDDQPEFSDEDRCELEPIVVHVENHELPEAPRPSLASRLITWRSVTFVWLLTITIAFAFAAIAFYARAGYTVTVNKQGLIIINKGRPNSVLWFHPTLDKATEDSITVVPEKDRPRLQSGQHFTTRHEAEAFLTRKKDEQTQLSLGTTTPAATNVLTTTPTGTLTTTTATTTATTTVAPATSTK